MPDKIRIFMNSNANMSRGKYAAHAVHVALKAVGFANDLPVVVLGAPKAEVEKLPVTIRDAGKTELEPGTLTAGTDWAPEARKDPYSVKVKQYRVDYELNGKLFYSTGLSTPRETKEYVLDVLARGGKIKKVESRVLAYTSWKEDGEVLPN